MYALVLSAYVLAGAAVFGYVLEMRAPDEAPAPCGFLEGLYFSVVTLSTVGYGDVAPRSREAKAFTALYLLGGLPFAGAALGHLGAWAAARREAARARRGGTEEPRDKNKARALALSLAALALVLALGAAVGGLAEDGWDAVDGLYWAVTTVTTVGYGERGDYPSRTADRLFAVFYIPLGTWAAAAALGAFADAYASAFIRREDGGSGGSDSSGDGSDSDDGSAAAAALGP